MSSRVTRSKVKITKQEEPVKPVLNFKVINVLGDGNCFFRAIYKCAKHSYSKNAENENVNNLEKLVKCFLSKSYEHYNNNELDFILDMREVIAKSIEDGNDNNEVYGMFTYLNNFVANPDLKKEKLKTTYKAVLEAIPQWMSTRFKKPPTDFEKFKQIFCKYIRRQGMYVCHVEINILKHLIETNCNTPDKHIILNVYNQEPKVDIDITAINILNRAEIHYNYLRSIESIKSDPKSRKSSKFSSSANITNSSQSSLSSDTSTASSSPQSSSSSNFELLDSSSSPQSSSSSPEELKPKSKPKAVLKTAKVVKSKLASLSDNDLSPDTTKYLEQFKQYITKK